MSNVAYHDNNVALVYVQLHCVVGHDVGVISAGIVAIYVIPIINQYNALLYYMIHGRLMLRLSHTRCVDVICIVHSSCIYIFKLCRTPPMCYITTIHMCIMLCTYLDVKKRTSIIWAQSDSNAQPSDLESDALPLRHRPDVPHPINWSAHEYYVNAVIFVLCQMLHITTTMSH